jgi:hypothetical protein
MRVDVIERSAAVLLGVAAGYVLWLAGITALTVIVPMRYIIVAGAIFLGLIMIAAFAIATHFTKLHRRFISLAFWCAPVLPALASIYSLIVLLN